MKIYRDFLTLRVYEIIRPAVPPVKFSEFLLSTDATAAITVIRLETNSKSTDNHLNLF